MSPNGFLGYMLFERLTDHLFAPVRDAAEVDRIAADPIPNRHAAVHGLSSYATHQSSLNAIFMTDYVFQVIGARAAIDRSHPEARQGSEPMLRDAGSTDAERWSGSRCLPMIACDRALVHEMDSA